MKASELKDWIERHEMPVARAAEILGVDRKTADRWLAGERDIPPPIGTECRLLAGASDLYHLRPFDSERGSVHWRASAYQGVLTVRAPSERMARQFAAMRYGRSARRGADGTEAPRNPWLDERIVECVRIKGSAAMPARGEFGVLDDEQFQGPEAEDFQDRRQPRKSAQ